MLNAAIGLRLKQQMALTPRLQQSVKLLQLSALDCVQELHQAMALNPFLEEITEESDPDTGVADAEDPEVKEPGDEFTDGSFDYADATSRPSGSEEFPDWTEWTASPTSLRDSLKEQLLLHGLPERDYALANLIVDALDEDGFLRQPLERLLAEEADVTAAELASALRIVQGLEPVGVGARDLAECLTLQLQALDSALPGRALALTIAADKLQMMVARDHAPLRALLACSDADLETAFGLIRALDPRPGSKVGTFEPRAIVPDVIVRKDRKRWVVSTNAGLYPRIRVNQQYADCLRRVRDAESAPLAQHLQEARWLVRNLEQRFVTIQRVAEAVVARQRNFFEYGDLAMRPLTLREIAAELELHESTVSRATSHKYMATPRGVISFKRFFSRQLATVSGGSCSATAIRALMREFIAAEDRHHPLSDVQLTELLGNRGVKVARRTVTKYRRSMQLPAVEARRA
jgi:RNA polymerase sigma-54 factor